MNTKIENWNELTKEQQESATEQLKGMSGLNPAVVHPAAKFFEEHRWVKIDKFVPIEMCNLLYHHIQLEATRLNYYEEHDIETDKDIDGTFTDSQAPGDFSKYGDPIFDTLLSLSLEQMQTLTGKDLVPTYSYHRLYTTGTELTKHSDRASCEISTTLCLGYDVSNIDASVYPDWDWPMFIEDKNGKEIPINMKPGDMIIYRGDELQHWREPFGGINHAQAFLHYNERDGKYNIPFDGRPYLGMPSKYRSSESLALQNQPFKIEKKIKEEETNKEFTKSKKIIY
jgi:hypothetical protein